MSAPIALFCYRRPAHLSRTLAALAANHGARDHDLVAFADGPRGGEDEPNIAAVRQVLAEWAGRGAFRTFTVRAAQANQGLRRSIVDGVSRMADEAGTVIVVEDDLETSPWFLRFCDDGLKAYAEDPAAASIHGYCYPVDRALPATFFIKGADCWGWATWRRAWNAYDDDAGALLERLKNGGLEREFNHGGTRDLTRMLARARDGRVDSWAVRWHASAFLAGMHTLYPGRTLVRNIGFDGSGTHCADQGADGSEPTPSAQCIPVERMQVLEDPLAWRAFGDHFRRDASFGGRLGRVLRRLARRNHA